MFQLNLHLHTLHYSTKIHGVYMETVIVHLIHAIIHTRKDLNTPFV